MRKTFRVLLLIGLAGALCIIMGCEGKYTGGGSIDAVEAEPGPTANGPGGPAAKANFGFNAQVTKVDGERTVKGQLQYKDPNATLEATGKTLSIHGKVEDVDIFSLWFLGIKYFNVGGAKGTFTSQPKGLKGTFKMWAHDGGEAGPSKEDWIKIELKEEEGGVIYKNAGFLRGGNLQYHPPEGGAAPGSRPSGTTWGAIKSR